MYDQNTHERPRVATVYVDVQVDFNNGLPGQRDQCRVLRIASPSVQVTFHGTGFTPPQFPQQWIASKTVEPPTRPEQAGQVGGRRQFEDGDPDIVWD